YPQSHFVLPPPARPWPRISCRLLSRRGAQILSLIVLPVRAFARGAFRMPPAALRSWRPSASLAMPLRGAFQPNRCPSLLQQTVRGASNPIPPLYNLPQPSYVQGVFHLT